MKEILLTPGMNCITDDYFRDKLFPGLKKGDSWVLFKLDDEDNILEMYTGKYEKWWLPEERTVEWHKIDIIKVDYLLMLFMLQWPRIRPYTKEVLDYALKEQYIGESQYKMFRKGLTIERLIEPFRSPLTTNKDWLTLFPGSVEGDSWMLFKVGEEDKVIEVHTSKNPEKGQPDWHKVDISKVDQMLLQFILSITYWKEFPLTKELREYGLKNGYLENG